MNRKGFTLVEVIGIVIVLSVIILTIIPNISDSLTNSKRRAFDVQIQEIESAAKSWSIYNSNNLPNDHEDEIIITLLQLKLAGLLDINFKDPLTGELFPDDMQIKITKKGLNYVYTVLTDTGSTSIDTIDPSGPQIVLNGSTYMYLEVNSSAEIPGATYIDSNGNNVNVTDIKYEVKNGDVYIETGSIDFNELGSYIITYSATLNEKTNRIKRYLEIVDTTAPEIAIEGYADNICIDMEINSSFTLPQATIRDNYSHFIEPTIIGNISNVPGVKKVIYRAIDDNNNSSEFTLCINMKDTQKPIISNISKEYNVELKAYVVEVSAYDSGVGLHKNAYSFDGGLTWQSDNHYIVKDSSKLDPTIIVRDKIGMQTDSEVLIIFPAEFAYKQEAQIYTVPRTGYYKMELWGASGGSYSTTYTGGNGAYTSGIINLNKGDKLYIYTGEMGTNVVNSEVTNTYNGGGGAVTTSANDNAGTGGGATDIRYFGNYIPTDDELLWNSTLGLNSRIMVAAGGGGGYYHSSYIGNGGSGGSLAGGNPSNVKCTSRTFNVGISATQISGGTNTSCYTSYTQSIVGTFGIGATGTSWSAGGGGGYYGGGYSFATGGSGGSSYISGYLGSVAITSSTDTTPKSGCTDGTTDITCSYHYSGKVFTDTQMIAGNAEMPSIDGGTETGHEGNGYARITYIES